MKSIAAVAVALLLGACGSLPATSSSASSPSPGSSTLQAVMSLLEGYSNLVMNEVGRRELPHFALLEGAYRRRQEQRTPLERAFLRLTGLEMKMRQYIIGERFCREVRDEGGMELLARVWEGPQWLPTMAEIQRPPLYIERARVR